MSKRKLIIYIEVPETYELHIPATLVDYIQSIIPDCTVKSIRNESVKDYEELRRYFGVTST